MRDENMKADLKKRNPAAKSQLEVPKMRGPFLGNCLTKAEVRGTICPEAPAPPSRYR